MMEVEGIQPKEDKQLTCYVCHKTYVWSVGEQSFYELKHFSEPKHCPECRKNRNVNQDRLCCDCGQTYVWSAGEQAFYKAKQLSEPKYCADCRLKNKIKREIMDSRSARDSRYGRYMGNVYGGVKTMYHGDKNIPRGMR